MIKMVTETSAYIRSALVFVYKITLMKYFVRRVTGLQWRDKYSLTKGTIHTKRHKYMSVYIRRPPFYQLGNNEGSSMQEKGKLCMKKKNKNYLRDSLSMLVGKRKRIHQSENRSMRPASLMQVQSGPKSQRNEELTYLGMVGQPVETHNPLGPCVHYRFVYIIHLASIGNSFSKFVCLPVLQTVDTQSQVQVKQF